MSSSFANENITDEAVPSMAFLEFLGEWETDQGEWIDPIELEDEEFAEQLEPDNELSNEN